MEELNIDIASEYLVMAATLTHIKSKMLLPVPPSDQEDDDEEGVDPRAELVRRLLEYQKYKHAAEQLSSNPVLGRDVFLRGVPAPNVEGVAPLAGLSLFLTLFIMWPVLTDINAVAVAPFTDGQIDFGRAFELAQEPLREWMLSYTREEDIALMHRAAQMENPTDPADIPLQTLVPAFMISELRAAFLIGFIIFVPFLVIDLVVASALMSMGMMMLPPVMISLPFKILLFVLVDGWGLVITALVQSYAGTG
jgi:flagellar biosynthetic protein FliP